MADKSYIGDGVYASYDGHHVILTTERGSGEHVIYIEPSVWAALVGYVADLNKNKKGRI